MRPDFLVTLVQAYLAARWRHTRLRSREAIGRYHNQKLSHLVRRASSEMPFYRPFAGRRFEEWPLVNKEQLLANFSAMNRAGLSVEVVRAALADGRERLNGRLIGMSTGTSGNRGYYVITEAERFAWLGTIIAKALPDALWRRHRVALALPSLSGLYRTASLGSRITLQFFDLAAGPEAWAADLAEFAPDTIVAPPKVLRWFAERGELCASNIFSGAEVLDSMDRGLIEEATGHRVREIYMATEGLFGVSCPQGTLHLAEDVVHFSFAKPDPSGALVSPIVTDFTRREQAMVRYRMNDLVELDARRCPCGSAFLAVKRIEGRCDDAFLLSDYSGTVQLVTPDILRNIIVDTDPAIRDFRVVQTGAAAIAVRLETGMPDEIDALVRTALGTALARRGLKAEILVTRGIIPDYTRKLRRVSRQWHPGQP